MNSETVEEIDSPNDEYKGTDVSASIPFTPHKLSFQDFKKIVIEFSDITLASCVFYRFE